MEEEYSRAMEEEYSRAMEEEYSRAMEEEYSRAMEEEYSREYLTEWPPNPPKGSSPTDEKDDGSTSAGRCEQQWDHLLNKRPRLEVGDSRAQVVTEVEPLAHTDPSLLAGTLLARWWKVKCRDGTAHDRIPNSSNPNTQLFHIARLPGARKLLHQRVEYLKGIVSCGTSSSTHHASLASCYQRLGEYGKALEHAKLAVEADTGDSDVKWMHEVLSRQKMAVDKMCEAEATLQGKSSCLRMPEPVQVEKRHADDLSFREFFFRYALTHTPVVITGLVGCMTPTPWTLEYIKQSIGHMRAPLKQMVPGSVEWARLEQTGESTVAEFIKSLDHHGEALKYLFDWSLPLNCPELVKELRIPKYFAGDFLQRTPPGSLYHDSWPSLFIAPAGITSELHVDAFGSNFWMALFEGKKRWVFFPPEDVSYLYPVYAHSTDAVFEVNLSSPDLNLCPLLSLTHPRECILQPGEVLFVPSGCPHRVENFEKSLAISANFVDLSNFDAVCKELRVNGLVDDRARQLLEAFESKGFTCEMDEQQQMLEWEEFKAWPRIIQSAIKPSVNRDSQPEF